MSSLIPFAIQVRGIDVTAIYTPGLIDDRHKEIAHNMRKLRNCYVHYFNAIHYLPVSPFSPRVVEKLKMLTEKNQKLKRILESLDLKTKGIMEILKKENLFVHGV